jgi:hypothetical protein
VQIDYIPLSPLVVDEGSTILVRQRAARTTSEISDGSGNETLGERSPFRASVGRHLAMASLGEGSPPYLVRGKPRSTSLVAGSGHREVTTFWRV